MWGQNLKKNPPIICYVEQFPPNYLKKNPPQNYVQKSGKLAQGSSKTHTQQVQWISIHDKLGWVFWYHCTDGQQKCKQVTIPTYHVSLHRLTNNKLPLEIIIFTATIPIIILAVAFITAFVG
jgi:hypothetical protein